MIYRPGVYDLFGINMAAQFYTEFDSRITIELNYTPSIDLENSEGYPGYDIEFEIVTAPNAFVLWHDSVGRITP